MKKTRILVVDDESALRYVVSTYLKERGYEPIMAANGDEAITLFNQTKPELVVLDVKMPGMDGFEVCRLIRDCSQVPVIMLTAMGQEKDILYGFECGADDYVTKPFDAEVLLARVNSVLRRTYRNDAYSERMYSYEDLVIDFTGRQVSIGGEKINVTATEYRMLSYLAVNSGCIVTPDQILEHVWGEEYVGDSNLLQVNMARLRRKLGDDPRDPKYILTRSGMGYMMKKN